MTVQAHTSTYSEIVAQLSQCKLSGCVDRTFGDGEYIWINDNNMIIAEAYLSRSTGSFWTCPDGYWGDRQDYYCKRKIKIILLNYLFEIIYKSLKLL